MPSDDASCLRRSAAIKGVVPRDADGRISPIWTLLNGAFSGAFAHAATYPLDTLRRRMQISGASGAKTYTSSLQCLRTLVAQEGTGSLFYGLTPTLIRSLPNLGIQFLLYETIKYLLGFAQ